LSQQECLESLQKTFGESCVSRTTVYNWYAEFNRGRDHFEDEPHAGRPRSAITPENIEAVRNVFMILLLVTKAGFTIMIQKRSVKVKFGLQAMILVQPKFVDNVLLANTCLEFSL
jgi:transposase